jgi:hypothetical protein
MTTVDDLIRDVASRHGVGLGKDDPLLILLTVNEHLIRDMGAAQEKALGVFQRELEQAVTRVGIETTDKAERAIAAALRAARESLATQTDGIARAAGANFEAAAVKAAGTVARAANGVKPLVLLSVGSCLVSVAAAVIALLLVMR